MTEPDIIADLAGRPARPQGLPCRIAVMRRDRPDLVEPFWTAVKQLRDGDWRKRDGRRVSDGDVSDWFAEQGFAVERLVVVRHRAVPLKCSWCIQEIAA